MKMVMVGNILINEIYFNNFVNISKNDYNTPVGLWIDELGNKRKVQHNNPRLKIVNNYNEDFTDTIDVTISDNPQIEKGVSKLKQKDYKTMLKFISKNYEIFLKRWNNEITTKEMFKLLDNIIRTKF